MTEPGPVRIAVVIPAYKPSAALLNVIRALSGSATPAVVVVDDGSGAEFHDLFAEAAAVPKVHLVRHAINMGKGAALKSGFHFALSSFPDLVGVVTADADGQHHPDDIERVAAVLLAHPDSLVLGSRAFEADVPLRSRMGNIVTRGIMRALVGRKLTDTQTGLRGIPASLVPLLLRIESTGYEYELEMLIAAHHAAVPIVEEPIRTIYEPGNASSHFNPVVDSMKIYFVLLRFTSVSLMTAALDNLVFYLVYRQTRHLLASQAVSRFCSLVFQYTMLRRSVFHSRQRHRDVLPKFVGLLLLNGATSYGAIRWATAVFPIATVPAKLIVESLLFFVNFALQRGFVFRQKKSGERLKVWRAVLPVLLTAAVGLEIYGFAGGQLFSQEIWSPWGFTRFLRYIGLFLTVAVPLLLMAPWCLVPLLVALAALGTMVAAGPLALLDPALFLISACALGSLLMGRVKPGLATQLCATLLGLAIYIFVMTITARLPIHYAAGWAVVLLIPIALDWRATLQRFSGWRRAIAGLELRRPGERVSIALLAFVLGMHWLAVLHPEMGADALTTHLAVPTNIAAHHAYTIQPSEIIWAVQPLAGDWAYAIVNLLGGELGTRLLNFAFLLLVEGLLYCAVRRWLPRAPAWFLLAVFASTPIAELVTGSLFVENMVAALVLGMLVALWQFADTGERAFLYTGAVLAGTALASKWGAFAVLIVIIPFVIFEARRHLKAAALAAALFLAVAAPSYLIAWWKTGNPFFPYLNSRFRSPLLPATEIVDIRFHERLSWHTPFDLTFATHRFFEGQDGSFGFQYLLLLPLAVAALVVGKRRPAVMAAVVGLGAGLIIFASVPNARYVYCVTPVIIAAAAAALSWTAARQRYVYRATLAALAAATAFNLWFFPSAGWYNKDFYLSHLFSPLRASRSLQEVAPYRSVVRRLEREHPGESVLLVGDEDMADVNGDGVPCSWHSTSFYDRLLETGRLSDMVRLMQQHGVRYFVGPVHRPEIVRSEALRQLLVSCAVPEFHLGPFYAERLSPACEQGDDTAIERRLTEMPLPTSMPGDYDDFDPVIRFHGNWFHSADFDGPFLHSVSYANAPGAEAEFAFNGRSLRYLFTRTYNRGVAEIVVDGQTLASIDLYSPRTEWQSHADFCCFAPGRHQLILRVAGTKSPASSDRFVDLDALVVR
jgi:glycosyltransferase involved in cell wall biosynthesis